MKLSVKKKNLIETIGGLLEERANLSPLASRIYALLILSSNNGISFETIAKTIQASKSSVSSNLNVLLQLHYVNYYTKSGDRKRYFRTSQFFIQNTMEQQIPLIEKELHIVQKVNDFNKDHNPEKFEDEKSVGLLFEELLDQQRTKIKQKLEEIKHFKKQV
jgi:DNA-binding transcriptional regulator GbsR (MarR family)